MSEPGAREPGATGAGATEPAVAADRPIGRSIGQRIAAIVLGLVVAVALAEGGLRVTGVGAPPLGVRILVNDAAPGVLYHCYSSNPNGEFRSLPQLTRGSWRLAERQVVPVPLPLDRAPETPWCVEYRNGSTGVRGPAVAPRPRPGRLRVIGVGDSFAYGDGVPEERALFAQLDTLLGDGVEILNCGRSGAGIRLECEMLDWAQATYGGSRSVFVFIPNDIELTPELHSRLEHAHDLIRPPQERAPAPAGLAGISRIAALISQGARRRQLAAETLAVYRDMYDPAHNEQNLRAMEERFRGLAQRPGTRVVLVLYPVMARLEGGYPLAEVHETVAAAARRAGLPVLDLLPHFTGRDTDSLRVHPADHHPNGRAHTIAAEAIADWLRRDVPGFLSPR